MGNMNPKVDEYIVKAARWQDEMKELRKILLSCGLSEEIKWGKPCYMSDGKNIAIVQDFKAYFALLFFKGHLLKDSNSLLVRMGENTKVGRQIRFSNTEEIVKLKPILISYIMEAVEAEQHLK